MKEENDNEQSLKIVSIVGIRNIFLTKDTIDDIWCEEDDTL